LSVNELIKEYKINKFRKKNLKISKRKYSTSSNLFKNCHCYDAYICGSDQIWNESFTLKAELKPTLSYFLDFVKSNKLRISYASSFGIDKLSDKVIELVKPELEKFKTISVRENTGITIIQNMGLKATLVVDPTLLISKYDYDVLIGNNIDKSNYQLFSYILHKNQITANKIDRYLYDHYFNKDIEKKYNGEPLSISEWLANIRNSRFVLTNSYHGVIFSIIYHKPFLVLPVEGATMNDRVVTLLTSLNLLDRIVNCYEKDVIDAVFLSTINWHEIEVKISTLRSNSIEFIINSLRE